MKKVFQNVIDCSFFRKKKVISEMETRVSHLIFISNGNPKMRFTTILTTDKTVSNIRRFIYTL